MTGRDLIIYILENHLENEPVFKDGKFIGFMDTNELALELNTGEATVKALIELKQIHSYDVCGMLLIPRYPIIKK